MKKLVSTILALTLLFTLAACGAPKAEPEAVPEVAPVESPAGKTEVLEAVAPEVVGYQPNEELLAKDPTTLYVYGPGIFDSGENGTTDIITGLTRPGSNEIIARWESLYPNCKLVIQDIPWDSYKAALSTATLDGKADVIIHGHNIGLHDDLTPYLENDPELAEALFEKNNLTCITGTGEGGKEMRGIDAVIKPVVVWIDKEIFADYGVEIPSAGWTLDDMKAIAEKLTGTDPVTGEDTYGIMLFDMEEGNIRYNYSIFGDMLGFDAITFGETAADATYDYASEKSVEVFQAIADLAKFCSPEAIEGIDVNKSLDGTNNWAMFIKQFFPSDYISLANSGLSDKYTFVSLPVDINSEPVCWLGSTGLSVYKDSPQKDWAWEFVRLLSGSLITDIL